MGNIIHIHLSANYDRSLVPVSASRDRDWWSDNNKTVNHARHCLPLTMANSVGYYILCPGTFIVRWDGNTHANADIEMIEASTHCKVDNHAAYGSFTIQAGFIPRTDDPGDYIYIKGIANERGCPYSCMEAAIEAWWSPGEFGLVYLLNQPGEFMLRTGQPIAQMWCVSGAHAAADLSIEGDHPGHAQWLERRSRPDYRKDFDYMRGKHPDDSDAIRHCSNWKAWK